MALFTSKKTLARKIDKLQDALDRAQEQTVQGSHESNGVIEYTYTRELVKSSLGSKYADVYKFSVSGLDLASKPSEIGGFPVCMGSTWFATNGNFYMFDGTNWGAL